MKISVFIVVTMFLIFPMFESAKEAEPCNTFLFDEFLFRYLPGTYFPNFFLENYAPDSTLLIEENNGFSHIDNPRVYFEGESYKDFNWNYDGFNINSALSPGRAAIIFPFSSYSEYELKGQSPLTDNPGLYISSINNKKNYSNGSISSVYADLGSYTPLGPIMIKPEHPSLRDKMLYDTRRRIDNSYFLDYMLNKEFFGGNISLGINHYYIKRNFNDFNKRDTQFTENGNYLVFSLNYKKQLKNGFFQILGGINSLKRDNEYAELGRLPQATVKNNLSSFFTGFKYRSNRLSFHIAFIQEKSIKKPFGMNHPLNIFDNDGGDILTVETNGKFNSNIITSDLSYSILKKKKIFIGIFGNSRLSILNTTESPRMFNPIYASKKPYRVILWNNGKKYSNNNLNIRSGIKFKLMLGQSSFLRGKGYFDLSAVSFDRSENNIRSYNTGFDLSFSTYGKSSSFYFGIGRTPGKIKENVNSFLEKSSSSGRIFSWIDINKDNTFQNGEELNLFGYTGGKHHLLDNNFKNQIKNSMILLYSKRISRNFFFNLKAIYKKFINNPWVKYKDKYGSYCKVNGVDLYVLDAPVKDFILTNSQFKKDPFYAQLLINFSGKVKNRWFFSFSLMGHMGMGYTAFGNGPNSNDIGVINESMADPNSWINGYGRLDGDRGYVSKVYFGFYLSKRLFLGVSIKYRDGNPFAFLNSEYVNDQWILYYKTIQAEDARGIKGGPREDYVSDISLKLSYSFKFLRKDLLLSLSFFNILDFGSEISEYVFSGGERYSMEMQIPKSLRLSLFFEL